MDTEIAPNRAWGTKLTASTTAAAAAAARGGGNTTSSSPAATDLGTSWGDPGRTGTAYDFRTDAITTPSIRQLAAITRATLNDDVFGEDASTASFEQHMARVCGRQAAAFVISGTMANQLSLATLVSLSPSRPCTVIASQSAHITTFEAGGLSHLSGATIQVIPPSKNSLYLTLSDIETHAAIEGVDDRKIIPWEVCPTGVISLENTSHGNPVPLSELRAIYAWARARRVFVHVDGARIWDAVVAGSGSLSEIAACADTLTLSFSKGIGAPIGAMVVGDEDTIRRVKRLRQSIGGGVRKVGILAAAAREAVLENFGPGDIYTCMDGIGRGALKTAHEMAARIAHMWTARGGKLLRPTETNMVWLDLGRLGVTAVTVNAMAMRRGVLLAAPRVVVHPQICAKALESLEQAFDDVLGEGRGMVGMGEIGVPSKGCVESRCV